MGMEQRAEYRKILVQLADHVATVTLNSPERKTLPLGLTDFVGERTTNYPVLLAAILLAALGSFLVYLVFQRHVIGGLTSGALKQ